MATFSVYYVIYKESWILRASISDTLIAGAMEMHDPDSEEYLRGLLAKSVLLGHNITLDTACMDINDFMVSRVRTANYRDHFSEKIMKATRT
jgi:hypothetical protein